MGLIQFFDELIGFISEEKQGKAKILIQEFIVDFEKNYRYEDTALQKDEPYVPTYYISAMLQSLQEEIRLKLTEKLIKLGEYSLKK